MNEWGFSLIGLAIALAVLAPNLLLPVFPPVGGIPRTKDAGLPFTILERAGQVGCLALLAASGERFDHFSAWIPPLAICVGAYWALWARYVVRRRFDQLYASLGAIPVPMAVFPVLAFGFAALWASSWWLGIAMVVLAIGHLTTSVAVRRSLA